MASVLELIDEQLHRLKSAKDVLSGVTERKHHKPRKRRHKMTAEGRARISAAMKKRWAAAKKAKKSESAR